MVRVAIVVTLVLHLPALLITYAAAGTTLSNAESAPRVTGVIVGYVLLVVASLAGVVIWKGQRWAWLAAGSVAAFWPITFAIRSASS